MPLVDAPRSEVQRQIVVQRIMYHVIDVIVRALRELVGPMLWCAPLAVVSHYTGNGNASDAKHRNMDRHGRGRRL